MQLILLSGGSGKRLWPLSNHARSKQFLPLLTSPSGDAESMIQRVVRQIRQSLPDIEITFATNITQRDIIVNQLGDNVNIVTEPVRRNTFPAIALAASFLSKERRCQSDEPVVVMPCDVYTESGYFDAIASMIQAVMSDEADLVLMGVKPTGPNETFGYIVPSSSETGATVSRQVSRFVEKPDSDTAGMLLDDGAYWNGGVFAFKLGFMMEIIARYTGADVFEGVRADFLRFPKISFDHEVVEKIQSVSFVPFEGKWKDLGTWNALCEELSDLHIGNVCMGENNENTHVVNELELPLFCDGLKDVVIAASPDGIMVCAKDLSEGIRAYVSGLDSRPMYEERRWGTYRVLDTATYPDGAKSLTKSLTIKAGKGISYQIHHHRSEVWTIVDGEGEFVLDGKRQYVKRGDVLNIPVEHYHAIRATTDLTLIEVQTGNPLVEEDIERFEWQW